jgi:hypothetical protein
MIDLIETSLDYATQIIITYRIRFNNDVLAKLQLFRFQKYTSAACDGKFSWRL